jgi:galactokinase
MCTINNDLIKEWIMENRKNSELQDLSLFKSHLKRNFGGLFAPGREILITRAPARLDIMGGIANYSGSVVLECPLAEATIVAVQKRRDRRVLVKSMNIEKYGFTPIYDFHLDSFYHTGKVKTYENLRKLFSSNEKTKWAAYVLGAFVVLLREHLADQFREGVTIGIQSSVPFGIGIASSASLEVAAMLAITRTYGLDLNDFQIARTCQIVENYVAGAACGIMDQVTSSMGQKDKILAMRCQPHELLDYIPIPQNIFIAGINSGLQHTVAEPQYTDTRAATFMGRRILFDSIGSTTREPYDGYLCNVSLEEWNTKYKKIVPVHMKGREFIERYKNPGDPATKIDPEKTYHVKSCTEHPINENHRAMEFLNLLKNYGDSHDESHLADMGRLMYESHESYSKNCGLSCKETDLIVSLVKEYGVDHGLYGAKITGGGSGGTVAVLAAKGTQDIIRKISAQYSSLTNQKVDLFFKSGPGALEHGFIKTVIA